MPEANFQTHRKFQKRKHVKIGMVTFPHLAVGFEYHKNIEEDRVGNKRMLLQSVV